MRTIPRQAGFLFQFIPAGAARLRHSIELHVAKRMQPNKPVKNLPPSVTPVKRAMCYIHINELDSAFKYLDEGYVQRDTQLAFMQVDPHFASIKEDPRYKALVKRMNFPED